MYYTILALPVFPIHSNISFSFFFLKDPATTEISPFPLPDALPISCPRPGRHRPPDRRHAWAGQGGTKAGLAGTPQCPPRAQAQASRSGSGGPAPDRSATGRTRSEEHTSELQSPCNLVCRLLLEKKK